MSLVKYYCIGNSDPENILYELGKTSVPLDNVKFISFPEEITTEIKKEIIGKGIYFKGIYIDAKMLSDNDISKIISHYLAVKDFVESKSSYGVFFEDTIGFNSDLYSNVAEFINELNLTDSEWDVLFDSPELYNMECIPKKGKNVYRKSNIPCSRRDGSCRRTHFYIVTARYARTLLKNFLPISTRLDTWYNYLFDKTHASVYWSGMTKIQSWPSKHNPPLVWVNNKNIPNLPYDFQDDI